jgi:translation initiation factor 2B subunit (eIF-2B alpha/beta/delta family)
LLNKRNELLEGNDSKRLERICEHVRGKWSVARELKYYTLHDDRHSEKVEEKLYELLSDRDFKKLSYEERFLLLASAWLHDIGMIPDLFGEEDKRLTDIEVREQYSERSERYINSNNVWPVLGLRPDETTSLGIICRCHRKTEDLRKCNEQIPIPGGQIRTRLLAAYLRLADVLHIPDRAIKDLKNYLSTMDTASKFDWFKSLYVHNLIPYPDEFKITVQFKGPIDLNENVAKADMSPLVDILNTYLRDEIDSIKDILIMGGLKYGFPAYLNVDYEIFKCAMTFDEIAEFKQGIDIIQLLDPLITTDSDRIIDLTLNLIASILDSNNPVSSVYNLKEVIKSVLEPLIQKHCCHVQLLRIYKKLDEICGNIKSIEKSSNEELITKIQYLINFIAQWKERKEDVCRYFIPAVANPFLNGAPILLYGYDRLIIRCLDAFPKDIKNNTSVYVCECSTRTKHRYDNRLVYHDGIRYIRELEKIGIRNINLIPDSSVSKLFSLGKVAKVLFGANGIGLNGGIQHKAKIASDLGHLAIADMAKEYNIPVYVIAEATKIGDFSENLSLVNDEPWYPTDVEFMNLIDGFKNYSTFGDIIPADKITTIITEFGAYSPTLDIDKPIKIGPHFHDIYPPERILPPVAQNEIKIYLTEEEVLDIIKGKGLENIAPKDNINAAKAEIMKAIKEIAEKRHVELRYKDKEELTNLSIMLLKRISEEI